MNRFLYIILIAILSLTGCSPRQSGVYVTDTGKTYEKLSADDIVVEVDGNAFRKRDVEAAVSFRKKLLSILSPRTEIKALESYAKKVRRRIAREWMLKTLFLRSAVDVGVKISQEDVERHKDFMSPILRKKLFDSSDSIQRVLGDDAVQFEKERKEEQQLWSLYRVHGLTDVSAKSISNHIERIKKYNNFVAETNRIITVKGEKICARIKEGLDFIKAVRAYSEETYPLPDGDMGWCTAEEIDEEEINSVVFTASVNSVVGPFDTEDGIQILRVEGHDVFETVGKNVKGEVLAVKLRRIRLRMLLPAKPLSEKEAYREIVKSRIEKFKRVEYPKLKQNAVICYPNGTNLFPRIKSSKVMKRKGKTP